MFIKKKRNIKKEQVLNLFINDLTTLPKAIKLLEQNGVSIL